ncbi:hypothetical protein R1flu_011400 [Riccia fluitans]|uniref:F-box protein n=1 Tax=Riccia fluitans TaxID=41844 RepID=A0ABD1Z7P6_9MARC
MRLERSKEDYIRHLRPIQSRKASLMWGYSFSSERRFTLDAYPSTEIAEMEEEETGERFWSEDVLQMIFCRIPFPSLLKVEEISKTWKELFSSAVRSSTPIGQSFQGDMLSVSTRWPQFCPVFVDPYSYYRRIWAFNQATRAWQQIRVHRSFAHPNREFAFRHISGPLMCLVQYVDSPSYVYPEPQLLVKVANLLTGEYKVLPGITGAEVDLQYKFLLFRDLEFWENYVPVVTGSASPYDVVFSFDPQGQYRVFLLYEFLFHHDDQELRGSLIYQYQSITGEWKRIWTDPHRDSKTVITSFNTGSTVYLDGALYIMSLEPARIWKYNLEGQKPWAQYFRSEPLNLIPELLHAWGVVAVGKMLMVATVVLDVANVYQVDKENLKWREVSSMKIQSPARHYRVVSDSSCVYFWPDVASGRVVLGYSTVCNTWNELALPKMGSGTDCNRLQIIAGSFQPGIQPFSMV